MNRLLIITMLSFISLCSFAKSGVKPYQNPNLTNSERVEDLLQRMSLEEKVGQMTQYVGPNHMRSIYPKDQKGLDDAFGVYPNLSVNQLLELTKKGYVGSFLHVVDLEESDKLQQIAMSSRLQIPLLIGIDAVRGNGLVSGTTLYPTALNMGSSFDVDLVREANRQTAIEMRATGSHWSFAPNIDVSKDARWGRAGETFGEDPYLVSRMGIASIEGLQGEDMSELTNVAACIKHFVGGGEPFNGVNGAPSELSERTLREQHFYPFKSAIENTKVASIMMAHNEVNGIPCHIDKWLMQDILKKEWNFTGFIVSDWLDVERLHSLHRMVASSEESYVRAVEAGIDMNMHGPDFYTALVKWVKEGKLAEEVIDRACAKILEVKFKLGLFEKPYGNKELAEKYLFCEKHKETALELAEKGIVLLKNNELLPLDLANYDKVLVTGPAANNQMLLGDWAFKQPDENVISYLEGLKRVSPKDNIVYFDFGSSDVRKKEPHKVEEAKAMAQECDLAILFVGENSLRYEYAYTTSGENRDRQSLGLLGLQQELVEAVHSTGIPTIVVLSTSRPLATTWIQEHIPAVIQAWEPGSMGGLALANILTGRANPSAKMPMTTPRSVGQIHLVYNYKPSSFSRRFVDGTIEPLYHFGYGLSYSKFELGEPRTNRSVYAIGDSIEVEVDIENCSEVEGTEVVQLYIRNRYVSVTRPVKELKDFKRVKLAGGEKKTLKFTLTPDKLAFYTIDMDYLIEPSNFDIFIGNSSRDEDLKHVTVELK